MEPLPGATQMEGGPQGEPWTGQCPRGAACRRQAGGGGLWRRGTDQSTFIRGQACPLGKGGRGVRGRWMKIRRKWPHEPVVGPVTSQTQSSDRELGGFPSCFRHSSQCPGHMGAHSAPRLGCPCPTGQHAGELRRRLLHGWPGQDPPRRLGSGCGSWNH